MKEDLPLIEPIRNPYKSYWAGFSWGKARSWLRANLGNNIDDVFSDWKKLPWIPARFQNLRHLKRLIEFDVEMIDEKPYDKTVRWRGSSSLSADSLYVHPETKILSVTPKAKRSKNKFECPLRSVKLSEFVYFLFLRGIWYEVEFERTWTNSVWTADPTETPMMKLMYFEVPVDPENELRNLRSVFKESPTGSRPTARYHYYCSIKRIKSKKQLNSKQIRQHNLSD